MQFDEGSLYGEAKSPRKALRKDTLILLRWLFGNVPVKLPLRAHAMLSAYYKTRIRKECEQYGCY